MTTTKKLATAALAGLFTASIVAAAPVFAGEEGKAGCNGKEKAAAEKASCNSKDMKAAEEGTKAGEKEKHSCKGKNSCKGQGSDGKNACKGKGSCATDSSAPEAK